MSSSAYPRRQSGALQSFQRRQAEGLHRIAGKVSELSESQDRHLMEWRGKSAEIEKKLDIFLYSVGQYFLDLQKAGNAAAAAYPGHADQAFGHITYAQHGEDLIFVNMFHLLGLEKPTYLDIGAHHPQHISNTALLYERGGSGVNVEANPNLMADFERLRPRDVNLNMGVAVAPGEMEFFCIDDRSGRNTFDRQAALDFVRQNPRFKITKTLKLPVMTLNGIVDTYCNGSFPHLLTMDIEGLDLPVIASVDFSKSSPLVICIEVVSGSDSDVGRDVQKVLREKGYTLYVRTIGNGIFVRNDVLPQMT